MKVVYSIAAATVLWGVCVCTRAADRLPVSLRYEALAATGRACRRAQRERGHPEWGLGAALLFGDAQALPGLQRPDGAFAGGGLGSDALQATAVVLLLAGDDFRHTDAGAAARQFVLAGLREADAPGVAADPVPLLAGLAALGDDAPPRLRESIARGIPTGLPTDARDADPDALTVAALRDVAGLAVVGGGPSSDDARAALAASWPSGGAPVRYPLLVAVALTAARNGETDLPDAFRLSERAIVRQLLSAQQGSGGWGPGYGAGDDDPAATVCGALALQILCGSRGSAGAQDREDMR